MSKKETGIRLVNNPIEKDYEDYICAYFQNGGLYIEKSIIYRETEEILELDIIITDFSKDKIDKKLVEIKSGNWGFNEIFKVKGWLVFLNIEKGLFIVKKQRKSFEYFQRKANDLGIELIDNSDLSRTNDELSKYLTIINEEPKGEIETLRFSFLLERKLLKQIKDLKKKYPENFGYKYLDDYFFKINSGTFFSNNPVKRIKQLFELFVKYKNLTAKICYELEYGEYKEEATELSTNCFKELFYQAKNSPLQISLYIEHLARITILKSSIEHLLKEHKDSFWEDDFLESLDYLSIPQTIKDGLDKIVKEPYFHRYPIFWQFFTYVLGGFILTDFEEQEYQYISEHTGIPIEEIPNAFDSYNKLFPKQGGWFFELPHSNIKWHRFFPIPFSGIGANHRRLIYLKDNEKENKDYKDLEALLNGGKTINDLIKWNNLAYEILK